MKIDGRCHCGQVTFTAEVDPATLTICHCTDCQTFTGSAFRANITAPAEHFALLTGTPSSYVKVADSGNRRRQVFCGHCGTPLYACAEENPASYTLRAGVIAQRASFSPRRQIWRSSAVPWVDAVSAVPVSDKG